MKPVPTAALPDYHRIGADFDRWLPLIQPVTTALLEHLPALPEGASVLDVACGTGEPGLTLARRSPGVSLLGVDAAAGMIEAARTKARNEHLSNARFEVMGAETLACADGSMDAVLSRFGLLMFGDVAASARELVRVLRAGGHFTLAVWDDMAENTMVSAVFEALRSRLPAELVPPFERLSELAAEGLREGLLREAGASEVRSEMFRWTMEFPSEPALWELISGPGVFTKQFAALDGAQQEQVRLEVTASLDSSRKQDGSYHIPHACRLFWGKR